LSYQTVLEPQDSVSFFPRESFTGAPTFWPTLDVAFSDCALVTTATTMSLFTISYTLLFVAPVLWLLKSIYSFSLNRRSAERTELPFVSNLFNPVNPLWMLFQKFLIPLCSYLPFGTGGFTRFNRLGWSYHDIYRLHSELRDAFMHVNPAETQLFLANPEAIEDGFSRRRDFQKPVHMHRAFLEADWFCKQF